MHRLPVLRGIARTMLGLFLLLSTFPAAFAQDDKAVFEKTIDAFNRTTTRYVLTADQEKKEAAVLAKQLADPAYDLKNLQADLRKIYDDNSKTETLSNTVSKQKINFIEGKPLAAQFATVIQLIRDDRKGKPYLAALEKELIDIKERALKEGISTSAVPATSTVQTDELGQLKAQIDDLQQKLDTLSTSNSMASSGIPLYIPLLLTLVAVLSAYNFWMLQRLKNRKRSSSSVPTPVLADASSLSADEVNQKIKEKTAGLEKMMDTLRAQMKRDMEDLRREMHNKSGDRKQNFSKDKQGATTPGMTQNPPPTNIANANVPTPNVTPPVQKVNTATAVVTPGQTVNLEVKKPVAREPERPHEIRKYADYPKENGFVIAQLYDSSDRRSIYQLSIPAEGDKASFSIVNDPSIHEYAIQNRERLLKDACDFEISSSKHTRIEVIQPGTLKLDGNAWQIHTKAQIKFV